MRFYLLLVRFQPFRGGVTCTGHGITHDQAQLFLDIADQLFFSDNLFLKRCPLRVVQFGGFQAESQVVGAFREQRIDLPNENCPALFADPAQRSLD